MVEPGGCHHRRPLGAFLSSDFPEIQAWPFSCGTIPATDRFRFIPILSFILQKAVQKSRQITGPGYTDTFHQPRFLCIFQRYDTAAHSLFLPLQNHGEDPAYRFDIAIKAQFSRHQCILYIFLGKYAKSHKNPRRHRQIIGGSFLMKACGGYVNGDAHRRKRHLRIFKCHTDSFPGLLDLTSQKADHFKTRQPS